MGDIVDIILRNPLLLVCNVAIVASAVGGYTARRRGWMRRDTAAVFMKLAIIGFETPLGLLSVWRLEMAPGTWKLPVAGAAVTLTMLGGGFLLARVLRLGRMQQPSFAMSASMSNVGYTLAGFIALAVLGPDALGYQFIYVLFWPFFVFLVVFPIAHHYATTERLHPLQLLGRSLTDIRSLPIYAVTAGIVLNRLDVPYPATTLDRLLLVDLLVVGGVACSYLAIGLSVVFSRMRPYLAQSFVVCGIKFVVTPLLMWGAVELIGLGGTARQLCLLEGFMPAAVYSVMIATLFGTDRDLTVTNFLVTHVIFFAIVLPFVLPRALGL